MIYFRFSILSWLFLNATTSCQMSDYAEKENVQRVYEVKVTSDSLLQAPNRDSISIKKGDSLQKGRDKQSEKEIFFTTP